MLEGLGAAITNHHSEAAAEQHELQRERREHIASGGVRAWCNSPTRSFSPSPRPMMPPAQTLMPASRTWASVSRRSCQEGSPIVRDD